MESTQAENVQMNAAAQRQDRETGSRKSKVGTLGVGRAVQGALEDPGVGGVSKGELGVWQDEKGNPRNQRNTKGDKRSRRRRQEI